MERLVYFLIILSLFGSSCSVSKRAFRDFRKKVDLIKTSLQRDIGDLKIEVLDLRNKLESERNRADRLEELLNGAGALPDIDMIPFRRRTSFSEVQKVSGQATRETSPLEDADRGEGEEVKGQASKDIFAVVRKAFHREKERARQFESTVTQKITKVSETTESFKSGIEHLRLTVETVAADAQKSAHDTCIEGIQNELIHIRGDVDVNNDAIVDLRDAVENVTDGTHECARDIEDIQNELIHIRGDVDVNNDAIVDLRDAVENVTDGTHESARDIEDIQNELIHIRGDTAASKGDIAGLQLDLLLLYAEAKKAPEHVQPAAGCSVLYANGIKQSGVYAIYPDRKSPFDVYCDMTDDGWTVIQRRIDGAVDFSRTWDEYVRGFGDVTGEYWLGLEKIHRLTKGGAEIYFDIVGNYDGTRDYAHYKNFTVHDATTLYKMNVDSAGYNGSIAELFSYHDDMKFSTYDRDNDISSVNCTQYYGGGGWWFKWCFRLGTFNGVFGKHDDSGIRYSNTGSDNVYVKTVTIRIRQRP